MNGTRKAIPFLFMVVSSSLLPAGAHELDLMASRLDIGARAQYGGMTTRPGHLSTFGLRYGHDLKAFGPAWLQLQGTFQAGATATLPVDTHSNLVFAGPVTFRQDGCALGLQFQGRQGVEFGLGPELRWERLRSGGVSSSQVRPWLTTRLGWHLPASGLVYVAGLEGAWALTRPGRAGSWVTDESGQPVYAETPGSHLRGFAANSGWSAYVGARF